MRRLILFAASCTCIGGLHTAAAQVPSLAEQWQAKAATRAPQSGSAVRQEALARLSARLHQALISRAAAKPTTSPAAVLPGGRIRRDGSNGTPTFMTAPPATGKVAAVEIADPGTLALDFVAAHRELFRLDNPREELEQYGATRDRSGRHHVQFRQRAGGVPVWGGDMVVHLDPAGRPYAFVGRYAPTPTRVDPAVLGRAAAVEIARADLQKRVVLEALGTSVRALLDYEGPEAKQFLRQIDGVYRPVWRVLIRPNMRDHWHYFVDAVDCRVVEANNNTQTERQRTGRGVDLKGAVQTFNVYETGGTFYMLDGSRSSFAALQPDLLNRPRGALVTLDLRGGSLNRRSRLFHVTSTDNTWADPVAVSAHTHIGRVFEYFLNTHGRLGLDGRGGTVTALIHVGDQGRPMDNAFWNGAFVAFGDGADVFSPLAGALDVAAHEMTHGVIERTVNLAYRFESGALNESFADVFAAMVDRDDWHLGEDIVKARFFPSGAMRDMADPNNGGSRGDPFWQPAHMDEFVSLDITQDNGGVHINSGIPNRACFLIAATIGRDKTEQIYYRILEGRYLSTQATFVDMRLAALQATADLYGADGAEARAVADAFDAVGIAGGTYAEAPVDRAPVVGDEWIAVVNDEAGDNSLILARPELAGQRDIVQLTTTQVFARTSNPIAISGDGRTILFVDADNFIRAIRSDGSGEQVVSASGDCASIALSPDGKRLAAVTIHRDSTLYILDREDPAGGKAVRLYNPTTQRDVRAYVTLFADALDWDHAGERVLFDAFNSIEGDSTALSFWRINVLDVDNELIFPVFPAQPPNISLGNPSFAQTNDNFFTFDRVDFDTESGEIWAVDLFRGTAALVERNADSVGHPQFSPDDSELVFQRLEDGVRVLRRLPLREDKMRAAGPSTPYARGAQLPLWFTVGAEPPPEPPTSVEAEQALPADFALYPNAPNPFNPMTVVRYALPWAGEIRLTVYNLLGQEIAVLASGARAAGEHAVRWEGRDGRGRPVASGVYLYRLEAVDGAGRRLALTRKMTLLR